MFVLSSHANFPGGGGGGGSKLYFRTVFLGDEITHNTGYISSQGAVGNVYFFSVTCNHVEHIVAVM